MGMQYLIVLGYAFGGFIVGYFAGVVPACSGENASNLCGLLGVFITGPIGGIVGLMIGLRKVRPRARK
jgi:hypothetical protein